MPRCRGGSPRVAPSAAAAVTGRRGGGRCASSTARDARPARPDEPDLIVSIDRTHSPGAPLPAWPAEVRCELPHQTLVLAFPEEPDLDALDVLFDVPGMWPVPLRAGVREQRVAMAGGASCEVTVDDGRPILMIDVPPPASQEAAASGLRCDLKRRHSPPLEVTVRVRNPM